MSQNFTQPPETPREIELRIPSEFGWEFVVMATAAMVAKRMGFPTDRIEDIKTAVCEATLNAIEHGNQRDRSQCVEIVLLPDKDSLEIRIKDHSTTAYVPNVATIVDPYRGATLAEMANKRGRGTFLIKSLVDDLAFAHTQDGNIVSMVISPRHLSKNSVPG